MGRKSIGDVSRVALPHFADQLVDDLVGLGQQHFVNGEPFVVLFVEFCGLEHLGITLQSFYYFLALVDVRVFVIEGLLVESKIQHGQVTEHILFTQFQHFLGRAQGNIVTHDCRQHPLVQSLQPLLAQVLLLDLLQPIEERVQDHALLPHLLDHDLGDVNAVMDVGAQQVGALELEAAVLDDREDAVHDKVLMHQVRQALQVYLVLLDDRRIEVPAAGNEDLLELDTYFQQYLADDLGDTSGFEVDQHRPSVMFDVHGHINIQACQSTNSHKKSRPIWRYSCCFRPIYQLVSYVRAWVMCSKTTAEPTPSSNYRSLTCNIFYCSFRSLRSLIQLPMSENILLMLSLPTAYFFTFLTNFQVILTMNAIYESLLSACFQLGCLTMCMISLFRCYKCQIFYCLLSSIFLSLFRSELLLFYLLSLVDQETNSLKTPRIVWVSHWFLSIYMIILQQPIFLAELMFAFKLLTNFVIYPIYFSLFVVQYQISLYTLCIFACMALTSPSSYCTLSTRASFSRLSILFLQARSRFSYLQSALGPMSYIPTVGCAGRIYIWKQLPDRYIITYRQMRNTSKEVPNEVVSTLVDLFLLLGRFENDLQATRELLTLRGDFNPQGLFRYLSMGELELTKTQIMYFMEENGKAIKQEEARILFSVYGYRDRLNYSDFLNYIYPFDMEAIKTISTVNCKKYVKNEQDQPSEEVLCIFLLLLVKELEFLHQFNEMKNVRLPAVSRDSVKKWIKQLKKSNSGPSVGINSDHVFTFPQFKVILKKLRNVPERKVQPICRRLSLQKQSFIGLDQLQIWLKPWFKTRPEEQANLGTGHTLFEDINQSLKTEAGN